jgi:DNA-binding CsgD family transcriptional regulator
MLRDTPTADNPAGQDGREDGGAAAAPVASPSHASPVPATPVLVTLADAAARCRDIASGVGASGFSLLFIAIQGEARRLVPVFDSAFPGLSALSRALSSADAGRLAAAISARAAPLWWRGGGDTDMLCADARFWAQETPNPLSGTPLAGEPGIVFPVARENGRAGAVAFHGAGIALDMEALCDTHARCMSLFVDVARQRPPAGGRAPAMSKREIECLRLTANGLTSDEIAAELGLSVHTANQYLTSSAQKLNAVNRIHAVAKALRAGLID